MAGVGKLLKQAQKMQRQIETLQTSLDSKEIDVTSGGGAVSVKINGGGKFLSLKLDPEFLKEDVAMVQDALLSAIQEAAAKAKELHEAEMQKISSAFQMPGMF